MRKALLAAAALVAFSGNAQAATIINGSFETSTIDPGTGFATLFSPSTAIDGWTVGGGGIDYIGGYWQAQDGGRSLDLAGSTPGSISQTLTTVAQRAYQVVFWLAGNPDNANDTVKVALTSATGGAIQSDIFTVVPGPATRNDMGWTRFVYNFTATGTSTVLTFASGADEGAFGPALDNVSISAIPETTTWAMMILGMGMIGYSARRRRAFKALTA